MRKVLPSCYSVFFFFISFYADFRIPFLFYFLYSNYVFAEKSQPVTCHFFTFDISKLMCDPILLRRKLVFQTRSFLDIRGPCRKTYWLKKWLCVG